MDCVCFKLRFCFVLITVLAVPADFQVRPIDGFYFILNRVYLVYLLYKNTYSHMHYYETIGQCY